MKTWKPTTAGILNIITGAINVFWVIGLVIVITSVNLAMFLQGTIPAKDLPFVAPLVSTILIILLVLSIISAIFPMVGGIFALQRRKWGWSLAGSIVAILGVFPFGVASTIFVAISKEEFE